MQEEEEEEAPEEPTPVTSFKLPTPTADGPSTATLGVTDAADATAANGNTRPPGADGSKNGQIVSGDKPPDAKRPRKLVRVPFSYAI